MSFDIAVIVVGVLAVGLLLGWLLGGRSASVVRAELAAMSVRAEEAATIRRMHDAVEKERDTHLTALTDLRARLRETALQ